MKKFWKKTFRIAVAIIALWTALTIWVESTGSKRMLHLGTNGNNGIALIVYDPDPFYDLDQQICEAFGNVLADSGWKVTVATVAAAKQVSDSIIDLYIFCANTYNWRPDWAISRFIKTYPSLKNKKVIAITLGSGSTKASKETFEKIINKKEAVLMASRTYWLMKPNDESRAKEKNVKVAVDMAKSFAVEMIDKLNRLGEAYSQETDLLNSTGTLPASVIETQGVSILKQQEAVRSVKELTREYVSDATFYNWKAKYGGMEASG